MKKNMLILFIAFVSTASYPQTDTTTMTFEKALASVPKDTIISLAITHIVQAAALIDTDLERNKNEIEFNLDYSIALIQFYQKTHGEDDLSYSWLGLALFYFGDYLSAIISYNKAIDLDPKNYKNYEMRGECKKLLHDNYGAADDILKAINLAPESRLILSQLYASRGGCLIGILKLEYEEAESHVLNTAEEALKCYNMAISLDPKKGFYHFQKGMILGMKGDIKSACLSLSKAGELGYSEAYEKIEKFCTSKN